MSAERRQSLRSCTSQPPSSSDDHSFADSAHIYPTDELKKVMNTFYAGGLSKGDGVVQRKKIYPELERARDP
ncbi:unnamed protein product [Toxocara canis]|nr:unnamed protein product [Toxocara canis]